MNWLGLGAAGRAEGALVAGVEATAADDTAGVAGTFVDAAGGGTSAHPEATSAASKIERRVMSPA